MKIENGDAHYATAAVVVNDLSWLIGGPQGSGVDSSANIFSRTCVLGGLWTYGLREYYSSIKGPHSYFKVRVGDSQIRSHVDRIDLLASFDAETLVRHAEAVTPNGGGILYNPALIQTAIDNIGTIEEPLMRRIKARLELQGLRADVNGILEEAKRKGVRLFPFPYDEMVRKTAEQLGEPQLSRVERIVNVLAVAGSISMLGFDEGYLAQAITETFAAKKKIIEMNLTGAKLAYDHLVSSSTNKENPLSYRLKPIEDASSSSSPRLLLMGNEAVALGKIVGGARMQTYYPITPASDESEFLESHENFRLLSDAGGGGQAAEQGEKKNDDEQGGSILVIQTEDEISAFTMATGAALTGTRAATSTSGPGFSLMVEGLGWAGMNEVPVVITLYSRGGPSTGLPTRHEQGDLKFVLSASHGEFPRIVLCSGDLEECFYDAIRAFNYAERYQLPVIHLIDKGMANTTVSIPIPKAGLLDLQRGKLINGDMPPTTPKKEEGGEYRRFAFTDDGVSPRAVLGMKGYTFWNAGDEHDEAGHIEEDPENRVKMMTKRMAKLETAARETPDEEKVNFYPGTKERADVTIVSWGSTKGAILEARELLARQGIDAEFLQIRLANPFPTEVVKDKLAKVRLIVDVEQNYSGQMAAVIGEKTFIEIKNKIVKFNGRPISRDEVYDGIRQILMKPEENRRVVLTHGA